MNNDLEQFSEERLMELIHESSKPEIEALVRIALSVKQAKPVAWFVGDATLYNSETVKAYAKRSDLPVIPLYTTPQPAHTEQVIPDGWKLVPIEPTDKMLLNAMISGEIDSILPAISRAESMWEQFLAAAPKPESE